MSHWIIFSANSFKNAGSFRTKHHFVAWRHAMVSFASLFELFMLDGAVTGYIVLFNVNFFVYWTVE